MSKIDKPNNETGCYLAGRTVKWYNRFEKLELFNRVKKIHRSTSHSDLAIPFLRIYPRNIETYDHKNNFTRKLITALFKIIPNGKQLKPPSKREWLNNRWFIHPMGYIN